jgi:hypothetical protein
MIDFCHLYYTSIVVINLSVPIGVLKTSEVMDPKLKLPLAQDHPLTDRRFRGYPETGIGKTNEIARAELLNKQVARLPKHPGVQPEEPSDQSI